MTGALVGSLASSAASRARVKSGGATRIVAGKQSLPTRRVVKEDRERLRRFFNGLSPQSRYQRFFNGMPYISEELLNWLTSNDDRSHCALVVLAPDGQTVLADGRLIVTAPGEGEVAIAVADRWHGRGIGRSVLRCLVAQAEQLRLKSIVADYLTENRRIIALLRDAQFALRRDPQSGLVGRARLDLGYDRHSQGAAAPARSERYPRTEQSMLHEPSHVS